MPTSRIHHLDLNVRAPVDRASIDVPAAEAFTRRVLARCDELLDRRAPGRIVLLRRLDLQVRLWEDELRSDGEVEAVATELADALDAQARTTLRSPDDAGDVAVFADEAEYRAEYLLCVAAGTPAARAWFFAPLAAEGPAPGLLVRPSHRGIAREVARRLSASGRLDRVLAILSPAVADDMKLAAAAATTRENSGIVPEKPLAAAAPPRSDARVAPQPGIATAYGGLFYLLAPALELGVAARLWEACLPENTVLARAAAALIGDHGTSDPASRLFGGVAQYMSLGAPATAEQHAEVARTLLAAAGAAWPRWRLAELPSVRLAIERHLHGPLLVASMPSSPLVLFAWPARSPSETTAGLAAFLEGWPSQAPRPTADAGLTSLDRTGRIQADGRLASARGGASPREPLLVPAEGDLLSAALVAQVAGVVAALFSARAGAPALSVADLRSQFLGVPARVVIDDEEMIVSMPMDRIDIRLRRAGLDRNPGWVPWLRRHVRFTFEE